MTIPKTTITEWKKYLDSGDISKIAELSGISRQTISKALNKRSASMDTFAKIKAFVDEKAKQYNNLKTVIQ